MARSRSPVFVVASRVFSGACRTDSQFPKRIPLDFTPWTRVIPAANSGEQSVVCCFHRQLTHGVICTLIEIEPSTASRATLYVLTVALLDPDRGLAPEPTPELIQPEVTDSPG
jgi:hypothetical protein